MALADIYAMQISPTTYIAQKSQVAPSGSPSVCIGSMKAA